MGQYFNKGLCPRCNKATLTIWPALPGEKSRKSCSNLECRYQEK